MSTPQELESRCFVYAIVVDGVARYIGKGTGYRIQCHFRTAHHVARRLSIGEKPRASRFYRNLAGAINDGATIGHEILRDRLSDEEAFALEEDAIASFPASQLWNDLPGGNGMSSETAKRFLADPAMREKIRAALKVAKRKPESRARTSASMKKLLNSPHMRKKWVERLSGRSVAVSAHDMERAI